MWGQEKLPGNGQLRDGIACGYTMGGWEGCSTGGRKGDGRKIAFPGLQGSVNIALQESRMSLSGAVSWGGCQQSSSLASL